MKKMLVEKSETILSNTNSEWLFGAVLFFLPDLIHLLVL